MVWKNRNPLINSLADLQGFEPGSQPWNAGGMAAYSGQTGSQGSYGWNHTAKVDQAYCQAVIANYAHRRCYYENAPNRHGGYLSGGRPIGWTPEDSQDQANGETSYITSHGIVDVSGPDVQHFQMNPLFAVYDQGDAFMVPVPGGQRKARLVAGILIRMLMTTSAGQVKEGKAYLWGDRGASVILHNASRAAARGLIDLSDATVIFDWFTKFCLPFYEKAPGHDINNKVNGLPTPNFQTFNGLFYLMPAFRCVYEVVQEPIKSRVQTVLKRWSQWCVDLDAIVPGANLDIGAFAATPEIVAGINGKPLPSLAGKLTPAQISSNGWTSLWAFHSAMIAEEQLGAAAKPLADKMRAHWLPKVGNMGNRIYIVNADGSYA